MNTTSITLTDRQQRALFMLPKEIQSSVHLLGEGGEGVVFATDDKVYKVYDLLKEKDYWRIKRSLGKAHGVRCIYPVESFKQVGSIYLMVYPYETSTPATDISTTEWQDILAELWVAGLIAFDVKPSNFIRTQHGVMLIDYNLYLHTDNHFLNMCVRAFVYDKYRGRDDEYLRKLARSAINQFDLPELKGVQEFVNGVYLRAIYLSSQTGIQKLEKASVIGKTLSIPFSQLGNLELRFFHELHKGRYLTEGCVRELSLGTQGYLTPQKVILGYHNVTPFRESVSLVIKTCAQDCNNIYVNVCHIIRQLSSPHLFNEYILAIDTRTDDFLRQFTEDASWEKLLQESDRLIQNGVIDKYIILPEDEVADINKRWFGIASSCTHSQHKAPVTSQLYLFEQAKSKYILQMDSDVLIGRDDLMHDYLEDMVRELEEHPSVVSVGFNIYQDKGIEFKPYFGYKDGGFAPEVRMGLFDRERMYAIRPLYNQVLDKGWEYTWFRTMHLRQKELNMSSIRGGDRRTFYIHPQNYRKSVSDIWLTILDRVEQGYIPDCQYGGFDCMGSYYDWCIPRREEPYVFVCTVRNVDYDRFLRMFASLLSQDDDRWGMVLIDDASDNGLSLFIEYLTKPFKDKVTLIRNRVRGGGLYNHYKAIHYFVKNPNTVIITLDGDDALLGDKVLSLIANRYEEHFADVVIGRIYQNYRLQPHYRYPANFVSPRTTGGNVWQHTRSFRKYLFDSLDAKDLKKVPNDGNISKIVTKSQWIESSADFAFMVPIVEMSHKPNQLEQFTYYYDRDIENYTDEVQREKEDNIAYILNRPIKNPNNVHIGRKTFTPNLNKIEIDITYACNLGCEACNRSCPQAPTTEHLELSDIKRFIEDSIHLGKQWEFINILGGEPTLHPELSKIVSCIIEEYIRPYSPQTQIQIVSNGYTEHSRALLQKLQDIYPELWIDRSSFKTTNKVEYFSPFNDAPIDDPQFIKADYSKGCWVTSFCGIGLNRYGYYACSVCGGIDRVLGDKRCAIEKLSDITEEKLKKQLECFCRLCGNFKDYDHNQGLFIPRAEKAPLNHNKISPSWKKIYDDYKQRQKQN